jgi:hypothetical protein
MKTKILIAVLISLVIYGCSKNDSSKPSLSLKSVNGTTFNTNDNITFTFNFTVIKGGPVNDTLFIARKFLSCPYISTDTTYFVAPGFTATSNQKANLTYSYVYNSGGAFNGCSDYNGHSRTDSVYFYFWLKDKDGNASDTIQSPKIILE